MLLDNGNWFLLMALFNYEFLPGLLFFSTYLRGDDYS